MALFTVTDYDRQVWENELKDFLPDHLFDVHTHVYLKEFKRKRPPGDVKRTVKWPSLVAQDNSIEDLQETYRLMYPGKQVEALMFTGGSSELGPGNRYIIECMKKTGWPGLYYSHPTESGDQVERRILEGGFVGTKSYLNLSPKYIPEAEIRCFDFFPHEQLKVLNKLGAIVMLHIPRNGRLRDPVNLYQLAEIREKYPDIRLIIAHIGRAYTEYDVGDAFEFMEKTGLDYTFDFTANCCEYAITECLRFTGPKRFLFGTDMPILRMRCHRIEENNTYINLVPPGLYGDPSQDKHLREVSEEEGKKITFFAYEEFLAFKRAAEKLNLSREDIEDCLCNNAVKLIREAHESIYGY